MFFLAHNHLFFGENTCTLVLHMVHVVLLVDKVVYNMQV